MEKRLVIALFAVALGLQDPALESPMPFRAHARLEFASKARDSVQVLEGSVVVRPGESLAAELRDEHRRRTRLDLREDAAAAERFFALDLWRKTPDELRERFEWRPQPPTEEALPEAVRDAEARPRPPVRVKLGPGARVAGDGADRFDGSRTFLLVPRDGKPRGRTVRVTLDGARLGRAVVDGPEGTVTCILSGFREVGSLEDSAPVLESGKSKSEERR